MCSVGDKEGFVVRCGGEELAKVLVYYGYEPNVASGECKLPCPFHNDVNPSMKVTFDEGRFYCFGCCASGDAYDFVRIMNPKKRDIECWMEYFRILKSKKVARIKVSGRSRKHDAAMDDIAHDYYYGLSKTDWYGDLDEGVCSVKRYLLDRGFAERTLVQCGAKYTYNDQYPVVFPMMDNGEFKGWVRRTTTKEVEQKRKYLYNTGFSRETTLVGDYGSLPYVVAVEGYMDRLRMVQNGMTNVVALLGWKMTRAQEQKLKDAGVRTIISALDNDECGRKGTAYLKERFRDVIRFQYMKGVKDPGEMDARMFWKMYAKTMEKAWKERMRDGDIGSDEGRHPECGRQ